jgi:hypothetical protein
MPNEITFGIRDNDNDYAEFSAYVPTGLTFAQYEEFAQLKAELVNPLILGAWDDIAKLKIAVDISALTGNIAGASSDVEQISAFEAIDAGGNRTKINIPGTVETQIAVGSDALDITDTDVAAFIAALEDGIDIGGSVIIQPSTYNEADLVDTLFARAETRNSGKRRA